MADNKNIHLKDKNKRKRFDFKNNYCEYEDNSWCNLKKYQRCDYCIRCKNGSKACLVKI